MLSVQSLINNGIEDINKRLPDFSNKPIIIISIREQKLTLIKQNKVIESYKISSAKAGIGNQSGSYKTPLGLHQISEKFGKNAEIGTIFKARKSTHKTAKILTGSSTSDADNITTRILCLSGMEEGINKGGDIDSHARYIYIHGTDEEGLLGTPVSHGCIRMGNQAVIELFDQVAIGTVVNIIE